MFREGNRVRKGSVEPGVAEGVAGGAQLEAQRGPFGSPQVSDRKSLGSGPREQGTGQAETASSFTREVYIGYWENFFMERVVQP